MRVTPIRFLAALIAAGAVFSSIQAPAATGAEVPSAAESPLAVILDCDSPQLGCWARAQGGSGEYVSWEWYGAAEHFDEGGTSSSADVLSVCYSGYMWGVSVSVWDSNGAGRTASTWVNCP